MSKILGILLMGAGVGVCIYGITSISSINGGMGFFLAFYLPLSLILIVTGQSVRGGVRKFTKLFGSAKGELTSVVIFTIVAIAIITFITFFNR